MTRALTPTTPTLTPTGTTRMYRPVNGAELALVRESSFRRFPPRLAEQPIFYPVTSAEYAEQIARDWNVPAYRYGAVLAFDVDADFAAGYSVHCVDGPEHREWWIPAEDLPALNAAIVGEIRLIAEFHAAG